MFFELLLKWIWHPIFEATCIETNSQILLCFHGLGLIAISGISSSAAQIIVMTQVSSQKWSRVYEFAGTVAELMTNICASPGSRPFRQGGDRCGRGRLQAGSAGLPASLGLRVGRSHFSKDFSETNPTASFFRATALSLVPLFTWISELFSAQGRIRTFISLKVEGGFINVTVQLSHYHLLLQVSSCGFLKSVSWWDDFGVFCAFLLGLEENIISQCAEFLETPDLKANWSKERHKFWHKIVTATQNLPEGRKPARFFLL